MENVNYIIVDGHLVIDIDLSHDIPGGETKSGNQMIATSGNWAKFAELPGFNFNMVLTRRPEAKVPNGTLGPGIRVSLPARTQGAG